MRLLVLVAVACLAPLGALRLVDPDGEDGVRTDGRAATARGAGSPGSHTSAPAASPGATPTSRPATGPDRGTPTTATTASPSTSGPPAPTTTAAPTPPDPAPTSTTRPPATSTTSVARSAAEEVLRLANAARAQAGCAGLTLDDRLNAAAQAHSDDMAEHDYLSHTGRDGSTFVERAAAAGFPSAGAENIAQGYPGPAEVMEGWMGSDGHRRNILDCRFRFMGLGVNDDGWYWTQMFG